MKNYNNETVILTDSKGKEVKIGDILTDFRGDKEVFKYAEPPHKPNASGKVNGYYAGVYDCKFEVTI